MHLKELNHRSPLRILDRSVQGGLGKGNLGVVHARAGVGKSGFLTCIALDCLLQGRKVLHVTVDRTVGHVRDFYDEVFADLARSSNLEEKVVARRRVEENRFIHSFHGHGLDLDRLHATFAALREHARFDPELIVIDGDTLPGDAVTSARRLRALAKEADAELWLSIRTHREDVGNDWHELPKAVAEIRDEASVIVYLQPTDAGIHVRLLRDHDRDEVADPGLVLDPTTLLVRER